jgi:ATPase subunit of ABC transporter with duplicated ATPase domains
MKNSFLRISFFFYVCSGNYDTFVSARTERLKNQQREYEAQKEYRDHIQV